MGNFCFECGAKIEEGFQFCPNCGTSLKPDETEKREQNLNKSEIESQESGKVHCKNCGEENDFNNVVCSSCGIKLQNSLARHTQKKIIPQKKHPVEKSLKKQSREKKSGETKTINTKLFLMITGTVIIVAALIIFSSGILNKPPVPEGNITSNNEQGVDLSSINKINELEAQLKNSPDDIETRLQLAHLQNDAGFYQKAIGNYKKYLDVHPENADARIDMGVCYYGLGDYKTSIDEMQKALKYSPNHQIGNLNLGIVNLAAGNLEKSKEWLKKAVAIDPNSESGRKAEELLKSHENNGGN
jgi:DNA-directed RNA polymerase subunit M/transcription elongation factor TFIIS